MSVCLSVPLSHAVLSQHIIKLFSLPDSHTIVVFLHQTLWQYSDGDPPPPNGSVECRCDMKKIAIFDQSRFMSEIIQDRGIVIMEHQWEIVCDLSNDVISNDLH